MEQEQLKKFKNIGIRYHSQRGGYLKRIARELMKISGAKIHFYSNNENTVVMLKKSGFDSVGRIPFLYNGLKLENGEGEKLIYKAKEYEDKFKYPFNYFFMIDRHLGKGFSLGGFRHPRSSYSENISYEEGLKGLIREINFWEDEVDSKDIDFFINPSKQLVSILNYRNIDSRGIAESRFKNYRYWTFDEFYGSPLIEKEFQGIQDGTSMKIEDAYHHHLINREVVKKRIKLASTLKNMGLEVLRRVYGLMRGYQKAKGYLLKDNMMYYWQERADYNWLKENSIQNIEEVKALRKKIVFFGLHVEPEVSLQQISPLDFSQLYCIANIARDLPPDCLLVVKENFMGMGRRPKDFYKQINVFKNVVMIDPQLKGVNIVRESDMVVTITGTIGFEGAVMGKPVISIGRNNMYNFLDHVYCVKNNEDLAGHIREALHEKFDKEKAKIDGSKFLQSVLNVSYNLEKESLYDQDGFSNEALMDSIDKLEASLQ
jgi:hypothetical protein